MSVSRHRSGSNQLVALDYEIAQEQASALGRLGRALEAALAALSKHDRRGQRADEERAELVRDAGHALWCLLVQRECCGLRDPRPVMRDYRVPQEVQNRMGIFGGKPDPPSASTGASPLAAR
jgi:plasmid stabilization system protein ParE